LGHRHLWIGPSGDRVIWPSEIKGPDFCGKNVALIGGGNTALDAIRSALRLGAGKAYLLYRRSEAEMPACIEEVKHSKEEGIEFYVLTAPTEYHEVLPSQAFLRAPSWPSLFRGWGPYRGPDPPPGSSLS
jgi:hypothetical protein